MKKVAKSGKKIIRKEISKEEAMEMFKDDEYKLDLISNLEDGNNNNSNYYPQHLAYAGVTKNWSISANRDYFRGGGFSSNFL